MERVATVMAIKPEAVDRVVSAFKERQMARARTELVWRLSMAFYNGNQYSCINTSHQQIEIIPPTTQWENREVINKIAPTVETLLALLNKGKRTVSVRAFGKSEEEIRQAKLSKAVIDYTTSRLRFDKLFSDELFKGVTTGTGVFKTVWDKSIGEKVGGVTTGDVITTAHSPVEIFPENIYVPYEENLRVMHVRYMSPETIKAVYGVEEVGTDNQTIAITPMDGLAYGSSLLGLPPGYIGQQTVTLKDTIRVYEEWERPTTDFPKGRYTVCTDRLLLYDGDLPEYAMGDLPFTIYHSVPSDGFFGHSIIERLIPLQREYNRVNNRIMDYVDRVAIQNPVIQKGSVDDYGKIIKTGLKPGDILVVKQGFDSPRFLENGTLPSSVFTYRDMLLQDIQMLSGISDYALTSTASPYATGSVLEKISSSDQTRIGTMLKDIEEALLDISHRWLKTYKKFGTVPRVIEITEGDLVEAITFKGTDLTAFNTYMTVDTDMSLESKLTSLNALVQYGVFKDSKLGEVPAVGKEAILRMLDMYHIDGMDEVIAYFKGTETDTLKIIKENEDLGLAERQQQLLINKLQYDQMKQEAESPALSPEDEAALLAEQEA